MNANKDLLILNASTFMNHHQKIKKVIKKTSTLAYLVVRNLLKMHYREVNQTNNFNSKISSKGLYKVNASLIPVIFEN